MRAASPARPLLSFSAFPEAILPGHDVATAAPSPAGERKPRRSIFLRLCRYVARFWYLFLPALVFTLLSNQLQLMGPLYSGVAIDALAAPGGVDFAAVGSNVLKMLLCYTASAVLSYLLASIMVVMGQRIVRTMRGELFERLMTLPVGYFDTHPVGDIISRISYDIDTINTSLSQDLVQIMTSVYTVVGSLVFMWRISPPMIAVFAVTIPISVLFTRYRSRKIRPLFHTRSKKLGELNGYAEEMLSGCRSIHAYHREEEISRRFNERNADAMDAYYNADYYAAIMGPSVNFINNLSISLVMIFGGILYLFSQRGTVAAGSVFFITLGGVAQFVQYSRKFAGPINEFANILSELQSAFSAAERVFRVLDEQPEPPDPAGAAVLTNARGEVSLRHISFGYTPETTILHDISLDAPAGKTIAIVGPTGAGKTTIINLLMRFYDASEGEILVDSRECRTYTRASLREAYTMVLQDTWLFKGTIFENIAYGREGATREEVERAAEAAHIASYIESLPDGYDTLLTDDGVNLSGGQRQLLCIARAMVAHAHLLILDEATSGVDSRTERAIQSAMAELMRGRTSFVIAHRLSTIQNADQILVLRDGRIIERGTHEQLLSREGGFYRGLYRSQWE